jgi:ABC-type transporter MlaC component
MQFSRQKSFSSAAVCASWMIVAALGLFFVSSSAPAQVRSASPAELAATTFVRTDLEKGLTILNDRSIGEFDRRARLQAFLASLLNSRRIALFALGQARRYATGEQIDQFVSAFRDYAVANYASMLLRYYSDQTLRVIGCNSNSDSTYTVRTGFVSPFRSAQGKEQSIEVDVRVTDENGEFVVTDISAGGVWLALQVRDEMNNYLAETNGNVGALVVRLKLLTKRALRAPAGSVSRPQTVRL